MSTLPCRHTCSRISSFISVTHTQRLFLSARSLCQHMHSLRLASSEPTGCLFAELPHNTAMISLTLSEAQPSMQSIKTLHYPSPFLLSVCCLRYSLKHGKTLYLLPSFIISCNFLDFFAIVLHGKHGTR